MSDDTPLRKFLLMHNGEKTLRAESLGLIAADENMRRHASIIEQGQDYLYELIHSAPESEGDDLTVRLLGIRLFNACAASLNLLLSGYYQNATLQMRDMLETAFLLDYFQTDPALIAQWRGSDKKQRINQFGPAKVRTALDDRDGFTERKRADAYELLSELAAHPTNKGFQMLRPDGLNAHCGPFFEGTALAAVFSELAKLQVQAVMNFAQLINRNTLAMGRARLDFLEAHGQWLTHFFEAPDNSEQIAALRAELGKL